MKIETKFGLGEIVVTERKKRGDPSAWSGRDAIPDIIGEVVAIIVTKQAVVYHVRLTEGMIAPFDGADLIGDPDYDQEAGGYPGAPE